MDKVLGRSVVRNDALDKLTGRLKYPGGLNMPGQLYGKMLWSERPHARIQLDTSQAEAVPGVVAVFTAEDVPYNPSCQSAIGTTEDENAHAACPGRRP